MISIADALEEIAQGYPFIETGLSKGIINYSAFAREVKPQIEKRLFKKIKIGAIVMALKRIETRLSKKDPIQSKINLTDLTVRSNLSEYTFLNSETLPKQTSELFDSIQNNRDVFCTLSEGVRETTFIINSILKKNIEDLFKNETVVAKFYHLSSITIRLPKEASYTPGLYYQILKTLAWEDINVIEVLSTYTELTVVVEDIKVDQAFSALKKLST